MNGVFEFEYRGLNIIDEISTVEVALDPVHNAFHIYDTNDVVEPEYSFSLKKYVMSDGFYRMANVLYEKQFFESASQTVEQWISEKTWLFYGSKKSIIKYYGVDIIEISKEECIDEDLNEIHHLYNKYVMRVL
ncbi:aminopeptidase [Ureibacillus sp. GCM10028918]|uniref:aminopeptidase n=1 Tax=Ureibacillus sp. GCM10028918 TaxID=3273429 RepID=UPI0036086540